MGGEGILNRLTEDSGAGQGAKKSHGSICSPRRKGKELNSLTLPGLFPLGQTPGGPLWAQLCALDGKGSGDAGTRRRAFAGSLVTSWKMSSSEQMVLLF